MQKDGEHEVTEADLEHLRETLKVENLTADYFHNLTTSPSIQQLIEKFLTESIEKPLNKVSMQNQFYIASFWGYRDVCKTLLEKYPDINVNHINGGNKWTPLLAASFHENGPVVMLLLKKGADINYRDPYDRSPIDYASASEIIWPHFASLSCKRTSKNALNTKQVFSKSQVLNRMYGPSPAINQIKLAPYQVSRSNLVVNETFGIASANGDVLADNAALEDFLSTIQTTDSPKKSSQANFNVWK